MNSRAFLLPNFLIDEEAESQIINWSTRQVNSILLVVELQMDAKSPLCWSRVFSVRWINPTVLIISVQQICPKLCCLQLPFFVLLTILWLRNLGMAAGQFSLRLSHKIPVICWLRNCSHLKGQLNWRYKMLEQGYQLMLAVHRELSLRVASPAWWSQVVGLLIQLWLFPMWVTQEQQLWSLFCVSLGILHSITFSAFCSLWVAKVGSMQKEANSTSQKVGMSKNL